MTSPKWIFSSLIVLFVALAVPLAAQEDTSGDEQAEPELPSVEEVTDKLDDLYRADSSHGTVEMRIVTDRGTRTLEIEQWTKGEDNALMVIRAPAREAGTATLRNEKGLWNYAPRADRLIRIPSGLLSDSWMGSHFTNDDLVRETSFLDDFDAKLEWATVDGKRRLKQTLTPKPKAPVVWEKVEYLMTADQWLPVSASYYDDGEVVRVMRFSQVEELGGRKLPTVMELLPQTGSDKGEKTRLEYKEMEFGVDVDEARFTQRGLRRVAKRR
ncbi:MAG: outer membrane lipoprotein-sorting protein [Persicimonas sp.]